MGKYGKTGDLKVLGSERQRLEIVTRGVRRTGSLALNDPNPSSSFLPNWGIPLRRGGMHKLLEALDETRKAMIQRSPQPEWMAPMLATLTDRRFSDSDWMFERKFDGERCLVFRKGSKVRLLSRNQNPLNETYPELEEACGRLDADDFIADGEIVAFDGETTSFSRLQNRMQIADRDAAQKSGIAVFFYLFDLMYLEGFDLTALDLRSRKSILEKLFPFEDPIRYSRHRTGQGEACYQDACRKGWEGIIAKRAASRYTHRRSPDWLKFKCINQQEFVIGGFTDPGGSRTGFGALLLGYYAGGDLIYAGKVGTGFDDRLLADLSRRLASLGTEISPFAGKPRPGRGEHWVSPELVCEVAFTEWTPAGLLRHPRFLGLRYDKDAVEVTRETPG
jgi:bifunctional non-homologous end joining protein LigD